MSPPRLEAMTWAILWIAFGVFCLLGLGALFLAKEYYVTATAGQEAEVATVTGTVLMRSAPVPQWVSIPQESIIRDGDGIRTNESSQAFIRLFDDSTVHIYSGTEVKFTKLAISRFGTRREIIQIDLSYGKLHVGVSPSWNVNKEFLVRSGGVGVFLGEGSFSLSSNGDSWRVRVGETGVARVVSGGQETALGPNQRVEGNAQGAQGAPQEAWEELVFNGDFALGLQAWQVGRDLGFQEGKDLEGKSQLSLEDRGPVVTFQRRGSKGSHAEDYIYQEIDQDVSDLTELKLSLEFKLVHQSLSGGGYVGSEYPMMVKVRYRSGAAEHMAFWGFYYQNESGNRTDGGAQVNHNTWLSYTTPENLMALSPRPEKIISVQVSASGWDYEGKLRRISLVGK